MDVWHAWVRSFGRTGPFDMEQVKHYIVLLGKELVLDAVKRRRGAMMQQTQRAEAKRDRFAYFMGICRNRVKSGGGNILRA